ncbi:MAG: DUF2085 domain-containing protein, partial [Roseiflexus sp.]|nr:DUF2085 domain-containing protein [Roseiflexus sp.]
VTVTSRVDTFALFRFSTRTAWALALAVFALVAGSWLALTPPGLLGKADAIGYAICHRIDLRSFHLGDRPLPLCARCTGIYLGALFGMATLAALGGTRAGGLPRRPILFVLLSFIGLMGLDGANSYLALLGLPHLYEPQNWLRLLTGTLNGLALGALLYPAFNQTLWRDWQPQPVLSRWRELGLLVAVGLLLVALVLTESDAVLYPLALLSALGVLVVLTMLYTVGVLVVVRRENGAANWQTALLPIFIGLTLALAQIAVIDAGRFWLFGTWSGFPIPR